VSILDVQAAGDSQGELPVAGMIVSYIEQVIPSAD